jgi:hypothetical protein
MPHTTARDVTATGGRGPWIAPARSALTRQDLLIALALTVVCAVTRLMARPASLWEWDDILFAFSLHEYDLAAHHPHPPGFPVFVMLARAAFAVTGSEHAALSAVSLLFASLLAAALYFVYRQIFDDRAAGVAGALVGSFLPSVWVHSGAGRSDEPGLAIGLIGLALALHGLRSRGSLLVACAVLGLGPGVRVTVLVALGPAVAVALASWLWRRQWRLVAGGVLLGIACGLAWYIPLLVHTTPEVYREVTGAHAEFAWKTDSIVAETENAVLSYRVSRFFGDVWGTPWIMGTIYGLSALGLVALAWERRWRALAWLAIAFLPYMAFAFVLNTPLSAPLYAFPYLPLFAGLASWALVWLPRRAFAARVPALAHAGVPLAAALALGMAAWSFPVVQALRTEKSPPVRAIEYLRGEIAPERDVLLYDGLFTPHVRFFLPHAWVDRREDDLVVAPNLIDAPDPNRRAFALTLMPVLAPGAQAFGWGSARAAERLRVVSLGRYIESYVTEVNGADTVQFLDGWYPQEWDDRGTWRWMRARGRLAVLNVAEAMTLELRAATLEIPNLELQPTIVVRLDGVEVDRFVPQAERFERLVRVEPDVGRLWSMVTIETDRPVTPRKAGFGYDTRELGLQLHQVRWYPAANASSAPLTRFLGEGWHPLERQGSDAWRWTAERATVRLSALDDDAELALQVFVPPNEEGILPRVRFERGGEVLDSIQVPFGTSQYQYRVPRDIHGGEPLELVLWGLTTSSVAGNGEPAAMRVHHLSWRLAPSEER